MNPGTWRTYILQLAHACSQTQTSGSSYRKSNQAPNRVRFDRRDRDRLQWAPAIRTLRADRFGGRAFAILAMIVLPALSSVEARGDLVTIVARGSVDRVLNWTYDPYSPGGEGSQAVPPSDIPYRVGDEVEIAVTYQSDAVAEPLSGNSFCSESTFRAVTLVRLNGTSYPVVAGFNRVSQSNHNINCPHSEVPFDAFSAGATIGAPSIGLDHVIVNLSTALASTCFTEATVRSISPDGIGTAACPSLINNPGIYSPSASIQYVKSVFYEQDGRDYKYEVSVRVPLDSLAVVGSNVPTGSNVLASSSNSGGVLLAFEDVTLAGDISVVSLGPSDPDVPPPPSAFDFGGQLFEITTDAQFTGGVDVCLPWSNTSVQPTMLHYKNGVWETLPVAVSSPGVYCATTTSFSLFALVVPGAALRNMQALVDAIASLNLRKGLANSLDAKLAAAKRALSDMRNNNDAAAIGSLDALIREINAQRGSALTAAEADGLLVLVRRVISLI